MRRRTLSVAIIMCGVMLGAGDRTSHAQGAPAATDYTVLLEEPAGRDAAMAAIANSGGVVTAEVAVLGALKVRTPDPHFIARMTGVPGVVGAARNQIVGRSPEMPMAARANRTDHERRVQRATTLRALVQKFFPSFRARLDPLDTAQWGLKMVRSDLARLVQPGRKQVLVGILDSGVDYTHPDLIQNYDISRARNFVVDIPVDANGVEVDGPCDPDCLDPVGEDEFGSGTFMAGIVGAAANGFGISGVAPRITLVDVRVKQDSGLVFLQPFVDGVVYAADSGIDVATLGFHIDRWIYNCSDNQADSPADQVEQRTTITAVHRALGYAHQKGVTLIGAMGDGHQDLGGVNGDGNSPTFASQPGDAPYMRSTSPSCEQLPVEGPHVIGVAALGPSTAKADYTNYGVAHTSVSAPGGYFRDWFGTPQHRMNENKVLSTAPRTLLEAQGLIDLDGNVTPEGSAAGIVKTCGRAGSVRTTDGWRAHRGRPATPPASPP